MKKNKVWTQEEIKNVERREMRRGKEQDGDKRDTLSWVAARDERVKDSGCGCAAGKSMLYVESHMLSTSFSETAALVSPRILTCF